MENNNLCGQLYFKEYTVAIAKLLKQCKDVEILDIILQILQKSK